MQSYSYAEFRELDPKARAAYLAKLGELVDDFRLREAGTKSSLPRFEHKQSGIEFTLIPGGSFTLGLTNAEEKAASAIANPPPLNVSELRPAKKTSVSSFLLSTKPILFGEIKKLFGGSYLSDSYVENVDKDFPAYVQRDAAMEIARSLGCHLPREAEWEYACRANTTTLFVWGNKLLADAELSKWLDLERFDQLKSNAFGLRALFSGDWCLDEWKPSHKEDERAVPGVFTIKGGGSFFWPWQDSGEWIWCMPANRMPSTNLLENGRCGFRLVRNLPA